MLHGSYDGTLSAADLWAQHNENRMFVPNVIALALADATGFNDLAFIALGVVFLGVALVLLVAACRSEVQRHPFAYLPAVFVLLSVAQYENALWGFQFAWFLVVACIAGGLAVLTAPRLHAGHLVAAIVLGIIASSSSLEGLTIWAAGTLPLLRPGISRRLLAAWWAAAVAASAFYLYGLNLAATGGPPLSAFPSHLSTAIEGFFVAVGNVITGLTIVTAAESGFATTVGFGVAIVGAACLVLASWVIQGRADRVLTIAAALIVAGLVFDAMLMPGRLSAGAINGTLSRYTTFNLLLLAGTYVGAVRTVTIALDAGSRRQVALRGSFAAVVLVLVCIQVPAGVGTGMMGGVTTHAYHAEAANLTANYAIAPPSLVTVFDYPPSYDYFETEAAFLEANHLNVFGDGESAAYQQTGVLDGGVVTSPLPVPPEFGAIASNPAQWRAWLALSSVYQERPDLQAAFPGPTPQSSRAMVAWALSFGMNPADPVDSAVLQPYADQYQAWLATEAHA